MKVLLLNQCFYPDVVSTAQHLTDLAVELADRGHEVTVVASRRGYDDPSVRFSRGEVWKGIKIVRIPTLGLGKGAKWRRALGFGSFIACCVWRLMFLPRYDAVVALTSPPLISFVGALLVKLRGGRFFFWVMDLNPDEAVAAGWLKEKSATARLLQRLLLYSLHRASRILVLDRFMRERVVAKGLPERQVVVIPPWAHNDQVGFDAAGRRAFRAEHGLAGKFVVMYSGNHSPCHPLDTVLGAARRLAGRPDIAFCFVGGGAEFDKVKAYARAHGLKNILCLPYQPLSRLSASLSAADMHLVVMGDAFKGIVHPCKIYNILVTGSAFLYVGPAQSHVADIVSRLEGSGSAFVAGHGQVEEVVGHIVTCAGREGAARSAQAVALAREFTREALVPRMVAVLEYGRRQTPAPAAVEAETNLHSI